MKYDELRPSERFASRIKCYWAIEDDAAASGSVQPVLPDGCPEIVFNLSERFRRFHADNTFELQPRSLAVGQMTSSIVIGPGGNVNLFGIRFQPAGAFDLFRFPLSELTDRIENVFDLWSGCEVFLHEHLAEASSFRMRILRFEKFLDAQNLSDNSSSAELEYAVRVLQQGGKPIRALALDLGWSERRLERRFREQVGVSPKMFARINRFQRLVRMLENDRIADLANIAIECGYYDQPHMNREFASFAGTNPTAFLESSHRMSELFVAAE